MTAPFTLIAFHCFEADLKDDRTQLPTELADVLESTKEHAVEIYLGAYVFDTQKGWQNMHRLCGFLRSRNHSVVRLPFEGEFFGNIAPKVAAALSKMGVTLYTDPPLQR